MRPARDFVAGRAHRELFGAPDLPVLAEVILETGGDCSLSREYPGKIGQGFLPGTWVMDIQACGGLHLKCVGAALRDDAGRVIGAAQGLWEAESDATSYANYVTLAETFPVAFLITQDGRYALANQAFAQLLEYPTRRELEGLYSADTIAPSHREAFGKHLQDLLRGDRPLQKAWWPHLTRKGEIVWLEGHPRRILWRGRPAILSTLTDVTEERRRELCAGQYTAESLAEGEIPLVVRDRYRLGNIVGKSRAIREVYARVLKAAPKNSSVLITGESGTGKEVVARAIHQFSPRARAAFVPVNCGAIPQELMESEFFGYRKGAFTGAYKDKPGFLDQAHGGTLFLDEVAELSLRMQVKLLRFLDDRMYTPLGSIEPKTANIRVIAATNRDLQACIEASDLREDFYFRLNVIPMQLPPLRERKEDITLLMEEFIARFNREGQFSDYVPGYVIDALQRYDWPGNVRELQNTIERFLTIGALEFAAAPGAEARGPAHGLREALRRCEEEILARTLRECGGNRARAAARLGLPERTFYRKLGRLAKNGS